MKEELMASMVLIKKECESSKGKCMWCDLAENIVKNGKQYWTCRITQNTEPRKWDDV